MIKHTTLSDKQKRTVYRAHHRGTKEMDWLLGKFIDGTVATMDDEMLDLVDNLMTFPEPVIEGWLMRKTTDFPDEYSGIIATIQDYHQM